MTICQKHLIEKDQCPVSVGGKTFNFESCQKCSEEYEAEKKAESVQIEKDYYNRIYNEDIPQRFQAAKISDFLNIQPILNWIEKPADFLFITGPCGTGKTHLAAAIVYALRDKKIRCLFSIASNLFLQLRESFNSNDTTEKNIIDKYSSSTIAVFDDIGAQKISDYVIESWYNIIDKRYGEKYPAVFTSNMNLSEISKYMSDRIASRLASGIVFELKGSDKRLSKKG